MTSASPEKSQLIQAYMILHSQQTNVRRRLSVDSNASSSSGSESSTSSPASFSPSSSRSSSISSNSPSPVGRRHSASYSFGGRRSSQSPPLSPMRTSIHSIPEESFCPPVMNNDEVKLADISAKIKTTLTDLLNCDAVKGDARMRTWVATRLMDVEHELKTQKRRRHSSDMDQANLIAAHLRA